MSEFKITRSGDTITISTDAAITWGIPPFNDLKQNDTVLLKLKTEIEADELRKWLDLPPPPKGKVVTLLVRFGSFAGEYAAKEFLADGIKKVVEMIFNAFR